MGVYVMLSKLTEKGRKVIKENPERIEEVNTKVERLGVKILSQYALFGPYDFVNILKAESDEVIMKASVVKLGRLLRQPVHLALHELAIESLTAHECLGRAVLNDTAGLQHHDAVEMAHR